MSSNIQANVTSLPQWLAVHAVAALRITTAMLTPRMGAHFVMYHQRVEVAFEGVPSKSPRITCSGNISSAEKERVRPCRSRERLGRNCCVSRKSLIHRVRPLFHGCFPSVIVTAECIGQFVQFERYLIDRFPINVVNAFKADSQWIEQFGSSILFSFVILKPRSFTPAIN